jgi:hypothetical protein
MNPPRLSKRQRIDFRFLGDAMRQLEWDIRHPLLLRGRIPREWHDIAQEPTRAKTRLTVRIDADVVKFFRALGPGYGPKMNLVLRAFMHARLAGMVDGPDSLDYIAEGIEQDEMGVHRPQPGETEAEMRQILAEVNRERGEGE